MNYRDLLPDELESLRAFAAENGRSWRNELSEKYWYNARVWRDKAGKEHPVLHRLRNEFGPTWLAGFKFPEDAPSEIKVSYRSVDGHTTTRTFKTLKGAQKFAHYWVGAHPEIGSTYAVSGDGIGKIMAHGATLRELFPENNVK